MTKKKKLIIISIIVALLLVAAGVYWYMDQRTFTLEEYDDGLRNGRYL